MTCLHGCAPCHLHCRTAKEGALLRPARVPNRYFGGHVLPGRSWVGTSSGVFLLSLSLKTTNSASCEEYTGKNTPTIREKLEEMLTSGPDPAGTQDHKAGETDEEAGVSRSGETAGKGLSPSYQCGRG